MVVFKNKIKGKKAPATVADLVAQNASKYSFKNENDSTVEISIIGEIDDFWGFAVRDMAFRLSQSPHTNIDVTIHSEGGSVVEGFGIRNLLIGDPASVRTAAVGWVASIATVILLAGDVGKVSMPNNSYFMIHNVWGVAVGEAEDMRQIADTMEKMVDDLVNIYVDAIAARGKLVDNSREKTADQVRAWMDAETWFTADEALQHGFIDSVTPGVEYVNSGNAADLSDQLAKFKNAPAKLTTFVNQQKAKAMRNGNGNDDATAIERLTAFFSNILNTGGSGNGSEETPDEEQEQALADARALLEAAGHTVNEPEVETDEPTADELQAAQDLLTEAGYNIEAPETDDGGGGGSASGEDETEGLDEALALLQEAGYTVEAPETETAAGDGTPTPAEMAEVVNNLVQENIEQLRQNIRPSALKVAGLPSTSKTKNTNTSKSKNNGVGRDRNRTKKFDKFASKLQDIAKKG